MIAHLRRDNVRASSCILEVEALFTLIQSIIFDLPDMGAVSLAATPIASALARVRSPTVCGTSHVRLIFGNAHTSLTYPDILTSEHLDICTKCQATRCDTGLISLSPVYVGPLGSSKNGTQWVVEIWL